MKNIIAKTLLSVVLSLSMSLCFASSNNGLWTCKTNASSAPSGSTEAQADKNMEKNAKAANTAFATAFQHCRDCTKITCSKQ